VSEQTYFDADNGLPLHWDGQAYRTLAALPGRVAYPNLAPWHASQPLLPRSQWRECSLRLWSSPVLDQGSTSSCVGHATAAAFRRAWAMSGQADEAFNPYFAYALVNHDQDAGAIVGDAVDAVTRWGMAYDGPIADGDLPHQLYMQSQVMSLASVLAKANRFRPQVAWHLQASVNVFDQLASAIQAGAPAVFGITIGTNFSQLADDGTVPPRVGVLGGHALHGLGLRFNTRLNSWQIQTQNSWSTSWGPCGGFCWLGEEAFTSSGMVDAFALGAVALDPVQANDWPTAEAA
jgi:hypothetical protein